MFIGDISAAFVLQSDYISYSDALETASIYSNVKLFFPDTEYIDGYTEKKAEKYSTSAQGISFSRCKINYLNFHNSKSNCAEIIIGSKKILVCGKNADVSSLYENYDVLITSSALTDTENLSFDKCIISTYEDKGESIAKRLFKEDGEYILSGGENINISYKNGKMKIRRA